MLIKAIIIEKVPEKMTALRGMLCGRSSAHATTLKASPPSTATEAARWGAGCLRQKERRGTHRSKNVGERYSTVTSESPELPGCSGEASNAACGIVND